MFEKKEDKVETKAAENTTELNAEAAAKAKKNEASKKMIARKKAAIATLVDLAKRMGTEAEKKAAAYLSGEGRAVGAPRTAAQDFIATLFKSTVGTTISEGEVFKLTKMGRFEMRALIKKEVNHGNWISFDAVKEVYTFTAKGDTAPAGWTGPQPKAAKL